MTKLARRRVIVKSSMHERKEEKKCSYLRGPSGQLPMARKRKNPTIYVEID